LEWVSDSSIRLTAGGATINGTWVEWGSNITWSGSSGTAPLNSTSMKNVYLYLDGSTPTLEVSATASVWNATTKEFHKDGDTGRRRIGALKVLQDGSTYKIVEWITSVGNSGRLIDVYYVMTPFARSDFRVLNGGSSSTWAALDYSSMAPNLSNDVYLAMGIGTASGAHVTTFGLATKDHGTGATIAAQGMFVARAWWDAPAGLSTLGGTQQNITWLPAVPLYYRITQDTGSGAANLDCLGWRLFR
jgi:hypothetical protein